METAKRQTAYIVAIRDILEAILQKEQEQSFVQIGEDKVLRVNIIGTLVGKDISEMAATLQLDDSSATITLRVWQELITKIKEYEIGDTIICIGKIRETEQGRQIYAEIIKKIEDPLWIKVRQEELKKRQPNKIQKQTRTETEVRKVILEAITELDKNDGADFFAIVTKTNENEEVVDKVVQNLLKEGEIFEIKPGKLRNMV